MSDLLFFADIVSPKPIDSILTLAVIFFICSLPLVAVAIVIVVKHEKKKEQSAPFAAPAPLTAEQMVAMPGADQTEAMGETVQENETANDADR